MTRAEVKQAARELGEHPHLEDLLVKAMVKIYNMAKEEDACGIEGRFASQQSNATWIRSMKIKE
jgi:hypothetical protein